MKKYNILFEDAGAGVGGAALNEKVDFDPDKMEEVSTELAADLSALSSAIDEIESAVTKIKSGLGDGIINDAVSGTYAQYKADIDAGKVACDSIKKNLDNIILNNRNTSDKIKAALEALGTGSGGTE